MKVAPAHSDDLPAIVDLVGWAFDLSPEDVDYWVNGSGIENWRTLRHGDRTVGCTLTSPCGHFFGGRSVPAQALAGFAIAPESRLQGAGHEFLRVTLNELAGDGVGLVSAFPSTRRPYRKVGFEPVGTRYRYRVATQVLMEHGASSAHRIQRLERSHDREVEDLYRQQASMWNGPLDRSPYMWSRVRSAPDQRIRGFGFWEGAQLQAYVYLHQASGAAGRYAMDVTDVGWRRRTGAESLLGFLGRHSSLSSTVSWCGGPCDPLVLLISDSSYDTSLPLRHWILRIANVSTALEARGYPLCTEVTLDFEIDDPLIGGNSGCFSLRVADGRGTVTRGGAGRLRLNANALALLYSGAMGAAELRSMSYVDADDESVEKATRLFAGPAPWVREGY